MSFVRPHKKICLVSSEIREICSPVLASIIQAMRCCATVCRPRLRLDAELGCHCDGNYVYCQNVGAYISN